ncbi:Ferrichrome-iron receptor precursor [Lacunisphaera limnophila]|uniref:Ferrichrome-iron receptor n=1 Tax=Lacunisphaera limnophila TaxID=1838286 RepID=A0A1D8ASD5_9BACT|nr:TonB-dependent receptor [Lacunisphaera limnophila]AOS43821.1 Ferrichrome-iron receptor precursor [Lacunisphaera limnophila]
MNLRFSFLLSFIACAATAARAQTTTAAPDPGVIQLEKFVTKAEKADAFTLPLDATSGTGSRLGLSLREVPASLNVMTQEVISARGLRTTVETVNSVVGVQGGLGVGSIPRYTMRGLSGNQVTILFDGVRMNTQSQSERPVDAFNLDRVEVLKGPSSVLFGEGAIGGSINYVSKQPDGVARTDLLFAAGSWGSFRAGVGTGGTLAPGLAYRADVSTSTSAGYVDRNQTELFNASLALGWRATERLSLNFFATYTEDQFEPYYGTPVRHDGVQNTLLPGAPILQGVANPNTDRLINPRIDPRSRRQNYNITDASADSVNVRLRLLAEATLAPDLRLRNTLYGVHHFLQSENFERYRWNSATQLVQRDFIWQAYRNDWMLGNRTELQFDRALGDMANKLLAGVDVSRVRYERGINPSGFPDRPTTDLPAGGVSLTGFDPGRLQTYALTRDRDVVVKTAAFFAEDALKLRPDLTLVTGLRLDHLDVQRTTRNDPTRGITQLVATKTYRPLTWRAGMVHDLTPATALYASYSYAQEPATQLVSLPTAAASLALPMQKGVQWEAGLKSTFWDGRADLTAAIYRIDRRDLATTTRDSTTGAFVTQSVGAQHSQGLELALSVAPTKRLRLEAAFAWTEAEFDQFIENTGVATVGDQGRVSRAGNTPVGVPKVIASLWGSYELGGGWFLSGGPRHVGETYANNNNSITLDAYTELEAAVGRRVGAWTFTLRGRNLLDELYSDTSIYGGVLQRLADPLSVELTARARF